MTQLYEMMGVFHFSESDAMIFSKAGAGNFSEKLFKNVRSLKYKCVSQVYSEPDHVSKMELYWKKVNPNKAGLFEGSFS